MINPINVRYKLATLLLILISVSSHKVASGISHRELTVYKIIASGYTSISGEGIYLFDFYPEKMEVTPVCSAKSDNPSFFTLSPHNNRLYAVNESGENSAVSTFSLDLKKGKIALKGRQDIIGDDPCYIATDHKFKFSATANYSGGSINIFPIDTYTECLLPSTNEIQYTGSGPDTKRQAMSHLHCTVFTPDGRHLLASDLGTDKIYVLNIKGDTAIPSNLDINLPPGSGPRHITFEKEGKYAYILTELSGEIIVVNLQKEPFSIQQTVIADTCFARGSADIHLSPDGKFLYASTRLEGDGIVTYKIDSASGNITRISHTPTFRNPRNFAISPDGKYVLVACQKDNLIQIFKRDTITGILTDTGKTIRVENVSCITIVDNIGG